MEDQRHFRDQFIASPLMCSFETTPERASSLSEPVSLLHSPSSDGSTSFGTSKIKDPKNKFGRKANSFAYRIREHVRLGPKFSETVKGKLSLGAKIIQKGGRENIFRQIFSVSDGEKLLKASQCYLSTTAGPIAGILFISTQKVAFCSERSISFRSPTGDFIRTPYKVLIPTRKIKRASESENVHKPAQKYIEIVTEDDFEFWFMGFVRYEKAFVNLQKAISMSN
ncbi:putative GEM-like protein 8 [Cornus florida]|uniref:putative GEM-like protein 8 n=1 Tax=Cornus florida TaxID=4283 RepID=UPI002896495D|nr:putative GEM-like protein 8 [Cornus florida]